MFVVIYSFCWCNVITDYAYCDVIKRQKVTYKLSKWKSTNFKLRKLPQHHTLWTFCILQLFFRSACCIKQGKLY